MNRIGAGGGAGGVGGMAPKSDSSSSGSSSESSSESEDSEEEGRNKQLKLLEKEVRCWILGEYLVYGLINLLLFFFLGRI